MPRVRKKELCSSEAKTCFPKSVRGGFPEMGLELTMMRVVAGGCIIKNKTRTHTSNPGDGRNIRFRGHRDKIKQHPLWDKQLSTVY